MRNLILLICVFVLIYASNAFQVKDNVVEAKRRPRVINTLTPSNTRTATTTKTPTKTRTATKTPTNTKTPSLTRTKRPSVTPKPPKTPTTHPKQGVPDWERPWLGVVRKPFTGVVCFGERVGPFTNSIVLFTNNVNSTIFLYNGGCFESGQGVMSAIMYTLNKGLDYQLKTLPVYYTPTITPTPSETSTRTNTRTATSTKTKTSTRTATSTKTSSPTRTATNTATNTPTPSNTSTPTSTFTPTSTPTPSNTSTPTSTFTPTNTRTNTPTPSNTSTPTSTRTVTSTKTPTSTATSTSTPTLTPTVTVYPSWNPFYEFAGQITISHIKGMECAVEYLDGNPTQWVIVEFTQDLDQPITLTNVRCTDPMGSETGEGIRNYLNRNGDNFDEKVIYLP